MQKLQILKLESSRQPRWRFGDPSLRRFDWSTRVTDGQTDRIAMVRRRTETSFGAKMKHKQNYW